MKAFVITPENFVIAFSSAEKFPADSDQLERITSEQDLSELAASWPTARLIAIWNNLPSIVPVTKFMDRKTAAARIWRAIQTLEPTLATVTTDATQPSGTSNDQPSRKQKRTTRAQTHARQQDGVVQPSTKKKIVLELLRRPTGATLTELTEATGWQAHSVRGFLSGAIRTKMGLQVDSSKRPDGSRTYSIVTK
jgi:hypothetical protein